MRQLSFIDSLISQAEGALKTLSPKATKAQRLTPAKNLEEAELTQEQKNFIAGLMRINHCGEVCAQALYRSQALTARNQATKDSMQEAAQEEEDHLAWCEDRLEELGHQPSKLNPLFYALSFGMGTVAGIAGDQWNLGFVAETERQVCEHLQQHLAQLPTTDIKTRQILMAMHEDEAQHAIHAKEKGAAELPPLVKGSMQALSKAMTKTTFYL